MIPNSVYFERRHSMPRAPVYFGRREVLTQIGDFFVPPWQPGVVVVLSESGPKPFVNVCRHRQSIILSGKGNLSKIRCPMHGWSWDLDGKSIGHPGFEFGKDLMALELEEAVGWMYAPNSSFAKAVENTPALDLTGFTAVESHSRNYDCSWMEYIDVELDTNHVQFIHPGLRSCVDLSGLEIECGDGWSVHSLPLKAGGRKPALAKAWWETLVDRVPECVDGIVSWSHIFPNIIIENYSGIFIGTMVVVPRGEGCTTHDEVWVRRDLAGESDLINAFSKVYEEIEKEDATLLLATRKGRECLWSLGLEDSGPYQHPSESALEHFHKWLLSEVARS